MLQERADQGRIQLLQLHHRWSNLQSFSAKFEQQLKAVSIGVAGVCASASMLRKMLTKKRLNVRCNWSHGRLRNKTPHWMRRCRAKDLAWFPSTSRCHRCWRGPCKSLEPTCADRCVDAQWG